MKKSLVLAMAMALGVTASAYAANPFSDVPAGHWAYDSISKLAAAGVIEGYGDDTFRGDRLMTRYEMAQIVAKAMAKGANVNKLAAEFADELDALGVRVAALEKKADNVKITGKIQYRWWMGSRVNGQKARVHRLRSDITFNGKINDGWDYFAMLRNQQFFQDDVGNEATDFQRAYVKGRVGGIKVEAGRNTVDLIGGDSDVYSDRVDHIKGTYGDKFKISGWYGKPTNMNAGPNRGGGAVLPNANGNYSKYAGVRLSYDWEKFGLYAEYDKFVQSKRGMTAQTNNNRDILGIGADAKFGDFTLNALYLHGKTKNVQNENKNGFTVQLAYKGADKSKPGTWGAHVKYYDQGDATYINHGYDAIASGNWLTPGGFKGFKVGVDYAVAKNMVANLWYYDLKGKNLAGQQGNKEKTILAQMVFTF